MDLYPMDTVLSLQSLETGSATPECVDTNACNTGSCTTLGTTVSCVTTGCSTSNGVAWAPPSTPTPIQG